MINKQLLFQSRHFVQLGLMLVFSVVGLAMGLSIFQLTGFDLVVMAAVFAVVGYMLLPIMAKISARALSDLIERVAVEVANQLRLRPLQQSWQRLVGVGPSTHPQPGRCPPLILDTSAIIDGRIAEIAHSGFLHGRVIVPKFILSELQRVADASDRLVRERGRRGLDLLEELKQTPRIEVVIQDQGLPRGKTVDDRLVRLAKKLAGQIVTTDFNLNKVAKVSGVAVLNVNELGNALRPIVVPGETVAVTVVQQGKEPGQGVAYFADGTKIVVENGENLIGQEVQVTVSRFLQTAAGRMIFARHQPR